MQLDGAYLDITPVLRREDEINSDGVILLKGTGAVKFTLTATNLFVDAPITIKSCVLAVTASAASYL